MRNAFDQPWFHVLTHEAVLALLAFMAAAGGSMAITWWLAVRRGA